jgi:hypothetical protein
MHADHAHKSPHDRHGSPATLDVKVLTTRADPGRVARVWGELDNGRDLEDVLVEESAAEVAG